MRGEQIWPVRLGVRTSGFHPGNRGSIPLRAAKPLQFEVVFYLKIKDFIKIARILKKFIHLQSLKN